MKNLNKSKTIVVALGGNALGDTPSEQLIAVKQTAKSIVGLIKQGHKVIVGHGNGPQVGMISLSFLEGQKQNSKIPTLPLSLAGSMSQGYIGLHLQQQIKNELVKAKINKDVVTLVTQTIVDQKDPSFKQPTKPIGIFYDEKTAKELSKLNNWTVSEDAGRGWRRMVASPKPIDIIEKDIISTLSKTAVVIAGGGGGIPTLKTKNGYESVDAVIDKDFTAEKIAELVNADIYMIVTAVDGIFINYGKSDQLQLKDPSIKELEVLIKNNVFPAGSMLPKVEAAINFAKSKKGRVSIITSLKLVSDAITKNKGTFIKQ